MMLSKREYNRYSRHLLLKELGPEGQQKLKQAKVLVVGAGGLGCPVLQYLAAAGVGTIGIVDRDVVELTNLQRQVIFKESDIGYPKAERAADYLRERNSLIEIHTHNTQLSSNNVQKLFEPYDLVVDCTDNFSTRYLINDACAILKKPMVYGSIHRYQGQVSVFHDYRSSENPPSYRCLFPQPPEDGSVMNCAEAGVLGVLPGIVGTVQANEIIKWITGIGDVLSGKLWMLDALTMNTTIMTLKSNYDPAQQTPKDFESLREYSYNFSCDNSEVQQITPKELAGMLQTSDQIQFIDVRENHEGDSPPELKGIRLPMSKLNQQMDSINLNTITVVYCEVGRRSASAIRQLSNEGHIDNLYNLKGGLNHWKQFQQNEHYE
ncbi:HesA/MoeB/ThiF family protein [Fodinibius sp.]|uniref:HesA/MoeB/ThiF family protein n=1 Tax=Fodinibius sp. TaxID=1872440 RepID=UPI002ACE26FD|nr:HesA/MoeB/ThiF family protein [Fodinibius sp.]MDZ7659374.1 HesA/MoeB/ThiF family protein [Fodinibius sp.]